MKECSPQESEAKVNTDQTERGDHPAGELIPVTPACAKVKYSDKSVGLFEELIACPSDCPASAEDVKECDHDLRNNPPDDILLCDEFDIRRWLRLVEAAFDQGPDQCVKERLDKDDPPRPSVQEVEMLVRNAGDQRQDAFSGTQSYSERGKSVSQSTNTVTPASEACPDTVQIGIAFDRGNPSFVGDTDQTIDMLAELLISHMG